ncbi:SET domain-containing protein [Westerdykella ornata]|uniref:SET domain-containing protein n=1 Tax=Westerdykella ornata TaxID=318751 RepID=A0A6A6JIH6_WESOR|nr:SET domain-containing protein [Westerdykella ornata]KAF2275738.1 SET domain-containing protein [Westerdykella ornata]
MTRPVTEGVTSSEVKILKEETPKAPENPFYEIRPVPGKGYGCFAIKNIKRGTRILADDPLLVVPIAEYFETDIKEEFAKLSPKDQALYFTLHSAHGQDPKNWPKHIHPTVEGRERCRIEEQHKARTGKEPTLISIFQTNCMEMDGGAAVFPNAARFNHSCNPNACFSWNPAIRKETIHAIRDIKKDEQITLSYCDITHDKATRRWELKHYGFICDCPACVGDDPQSFAGKSETRRYRLMELEQEFRLTRGEYIGFGVSQPGFIEKLLEYATLLLEEGDYTVRLANTYLDIAIVCEKKGDLLLAKRSALKALRIKLETQGPDYPDIPKYQGVVQRIKRKMAEQEAAQAGNKS